jgi:hypothetical protein
VIWENKKEVAFYKLLLLLHFAFASKIFFCELASKNYLVLKKLFPNVYMSCDGRRLPRSHITIQLPLDLLCVDKHTYIDTE